MSAVNPADLNDLSRKLRELRKEFVALSPDGDAYYSIPQAHANLALASIDAALANFELAALHQAHAIGASGGARW